MTEADENACAEMLRGLFVELPDAAFNQILEVLKSEKFSACFVRTITCSRLLAGIFYQAIFDRKADEAALEELTTAMLERDASDVIRTLLVSPEYRSREMPAPDTVGSSRRENRSTLDAVALPFVSYAQNFEDVMLWRALGDIKQGFYIDVGAYSPINDSVTAAFYERGWNGINIEPVSEWFEDLLAVRARDLNLKLCVGEAQGEAILYVIPATGLSTLNASIAGEHRQKAFPVQEEHIEVLPLAEICRRHVGGAIHFLKIDAEGAERDILAGADFTTFRPWIVLLEATAPLSQQTTHHEWEPILLQAGYDFVWFDGLNRFYVAKEHPSLALAFVSPPNVFDVIKLNPRHPFVA